MDKQTQGSKKKARYQKYLQRQQKRDKERLRLIRRGDITGTIEEMAEVMGIKLKQQKAPNGER